MERSISVRPGQETPGRIDRERKQHQEVQSKLLVHVHSEHSQHSQHSVHVVAEGEGPAQGALNGVNGRAQGEGEREDEGEGDDEEPPSF